MNLKRFALAFAVTALSVATALPALAADVYTVDPAHSNVSFEVRHLMSVVRGRFTDFAGTVIFDKANPANSSVEFTVQATSVNTDNADRDKDLRSENFFWVDKNPEITFRSDKIEKTGENTYRVGGTLAIRGVSKPVTLDVEYLGEVKDPWGNTRAGFATSTTINRKDYGLEWNKTLETGGLLVGDEVKISINLEAIKKV